MEYQQFKLKEGPPTYYDECPIEGPEGQLKEALSEVLIAIGFLELGEAELAIDTLSGLMEQHGMRVSEPLPSFIPQAFQGCKAVRFAIELHEQHHRNLEERRMKEEKQAFREAKKAAGKLKKIQKTGGDGS